MTPAEPDSTTLSKAFPARVGFGLLGLLALTALLYYLGYERLATGGALGFPLDDSWIHLTFARSLAAGEGLAYGDGGWVAGSTGPLWTGLLALCFLVPGSVALWAKVLGGVGYVVSALLLHRVARDYGLGPRLALMAAGLLVLTDWMVWSALSGMEISLFVVLSLAGLLVHNREAAGGWQRHWALPIFGFAVLARPEGILLLGLATAERIVEVRQSTVQCTGHSTGQSTGQGRQLRLRWPPGLLRYLMLALAVVLPVSLFAAAVHGSPFPTTLAVKAGASPGDLLSFGDLLPSLRDLWTIAGILFRPQPWVCLFAGAGTLALCFGERGRWPRRSLLPVLWVLGLPVAYSVMAQAGQPLPVGNFGRYVFPLFPFVILLGTIGMTDAASWLGRPTRFGRALVPLGWLGFLLVVLPSLKATVIGAERYAASVADVEQSDVAIARWISEHVPPNAVLGVQDIGALGFLTLNPLVDLVGIINPEVLPYTQGSLRGADPSGLQGLFLFVRERAVDFLVLFPSSYGGRRTLLRLEPGLRVVHRVEIPRNITMAGTELVVLVTPWSQWAQDSSGREH